ncbi:MAG TPA: M28 family peptidase [Anaerolineae bacterium]
MSGENRTGAPTDEAKLLAQFSRDRLIETNRQIAQWVRVSGSPEERAAFEYVREQLESYGLRTQWIDHPALISHPVEARLDQINVLGTAEQTYTCLSHAFSASVENLEAEIVDLGFGTPKDYAAQDVRSKVVLLNGLAGPTAVYQAERAGAAAQVFINDDHLHNMIVSTVWGTPTPDSAKRLPKTPAVSIKDTDGHALREHIAAMPTRVRLRTKVVTEWRTTPIVVGELDGHATDDFVLFSGHLDSWDYGAMDNGSANATMLEVARLLAPMKQELYRGVRVIFWSGHSHGRYSGSTWYADHYWEELYDRCVAHVNVDSTGARGANFYGTFQAHMELADLGASVIREHTGQSSRPFRMSRAGDMSFNGIGIPSLFMELSQVPLADATSRGAADNYVTLSLGTLMGSTMPWWWHTSEDTMDKVDPAVLELDTRIYLSTIWRLGHPPLLPMEFRRVVADIRKELADLQQAAGDQIDLGGLDRQAIVLAGHVETLASQMKVDHTSEEITRLNRQIKHLSRTLNPITYTLTGRFEHDPAWGIPFLPGLQGARQLAQLNPMSDECHFLKTQLVRNANAVAFALRQAIESFS